MQEAIVSALSSQDLNEFKKLATPSEINSIIMHLQDFPTPLRKHAAFLFGKSVQGVSLFEAILFRMEEEKYATRSTKKLKEFVNYTLPELDIKQLNTHRWGDQNTTLHLLSYIGDIKAIKLLIMKGALFTQKNALGLSPGDMASTSELRHYFKDITPLNPLQTSKPIKSKNINTFTIHSPEKPVSTNPFLMADKRNAPKDPHPLPPDILQSISTFATLERPDIYKLVERQVRKECIEKTVWCEKRGLPNAWLPFPTPMPEKVSLSRGKKVDTAWSLKRSLENVFSPLEGHDNTQRVDVNHELKNENEHETKQTLMYKERVDVNHELKNENEHETKQTLMSIDMDDDLQKLQERKGNYPDISKWDDAQESQSTLLDRVSETVLIHEKQDILDFNYFKSSHPYPLEEINLDTSIPKNIHISEIDQVQDSAIKLIDSPISNTHLMPLYSDITKVNRSMIEMSVVDIGSLKEEANGWFKDIFVGGLDAVPERETSIHTKVRGLGLYSDSTPRIKKSVRFSDAWSGKLTQCIHIDQDLPVITQFSSFHTGYILFRLDTIKLKQRLNGDISLTIVPKYNNGEPETIKTVILSNQDITQTLHQEYTFDVSETSEIVLELQISQCLRQGQASNKRTMDTIRSFMDTFRRKPLPLQPCDDNTFYLSGQIEKKMDCNSLLFSPQSFKEHILFTSGEITDICINMELSFTAAYVPHFDRSQMNWIPTTLSQFEEIVELTHHDIHIEMSGHLIHITEDSITSPRMYALKELTLYATDTLNDDSPKMIELSNLSFLEGMGMSFDFSNNVGDTHIITRSWRAFSKKEYTHPKFLLGFNDMQEIIFEAGSSKTCFEWMQAIYLIKSNISYYEKLPFITEMNNLKGSFKNRISQS